MGKKALVTGVAGFIGYHMIRKLITEHPDWDIVGIDSINNYYDPNLKYDRLSQLGLSSQEISYGSLVNGNGVKFLQLNLEDKEEMMRLFEKEQFDYIIHLAAQAGVRYSIQNPYSYLDSNLSGFLNILEGARHYGCQHLIYASSSSVYGLNEEMPFQVGQNVDHPISLYAASKKANELMAHTYSYLYEIPTTGLRFFTVYGPWGRPDMALFIFTKNILEGNPIDVYNYGKMKRDFTYIDDIVEAINRLVPNVAQKDEQFSGKNPDPSKSVAPYRLHNIGNNSPVKLMDFIEAIEEKTGYKAEKNYMPLQPGDVPATYADVTELYDEVNFKPKTSIKEGISNFIDWYREYYQV